MTKNSRRTSGSSKPISTDGPTQSGAAATGLFSSPWKRYSLGTFFLEVVRLYAGSFLSSLPVALIVLGVSLTAGVVGGYLAHLELPGMSFAGLVSGGARWAVFVSLVATPFTSAAGLRILLQRELEREAGTALRFLKIRRYRLIGSAVYLALPLSLAALVFPIGLLALPFYVFWMFTPHAVLVEGDGGRTALRRSRTIFQGEFSATALPATISFVFLLLALTMAHNLVPGPPQGGFVLDKERDLYVRELGEDESYDPATRTLVASDGNRVALTGADYDEESRTLSRPAPPPVPASTALLWAGVPLVLAGILDPIRWLTQALLYINLRMRREGLTVSALLRELGADSI